MRKGKKMRERRQRKRERDKWLERERERKGEIMVRMNFMSKCGWEEESGHT